MTNNAMRFFQTKKEAIMIELSVSETRSLLRTLDKVTDAYNDLDSVLCPDFVDSVHEEAVALDLKYREKMMRVLTAAVSSLFDNVDQQSVADFIRDLIEP